MNRRGFLQLLGLGATAGVGASIPLFGTESIASAAFLPFVARHLVVAPGAKTRGIVEPLDSNGKHSGLNLREGPSGLRTPPFPNFYFRPTPGPLREYVFLRSDQDPYFEFHSKAFSIQQTLKERALALFRRPEVAGMDLVTVVGDPIKAVFFASQDDPSWWEAFTESETPSGHLSHVYHSRRMSPEIKRDSNQTHGFLISTRFDQYLVAGEVEGEVLSEQGELPISDKLDIDRLIWIDKKIRG